jgi:1-acyl-sn-glycerol-3-phosphate acyltransferase
MHRTVFNTPVIKTVLRGVSLLGLRLAGWRLEGHLPAEASRCVLIGAPHTSNWDLPWTLMAAFAWRLNLYWMGKASLFKPPFGPVMRWLGGVAVDRSQSNNLVAASAAALREADGPIQLAVPPEGTRSKVRQWKTGFYYIAHTGGVPIVMAYMDYPNRRIGLGPMLRPSGDIDTDMAGIRAFYAPIRGKRSDHFDPG